MTTIPKRIIVKGSVNRKSISSDMSMKKKVKVYDDLG